MLSRTLGFATVSILIGFFVALPARAQNLEAGKSPAQIFSSACSACHKSMRGLVKTVPAGSLPGFLRQHYTTSSNMAAAMSAYLLGHGGVDRRRGEAPGRHGRRDRRDAREQAAPPQQQPTFTPFWMRRPAPPPQAAEQAPRPHRRARKPKRAARPAAESGKSEAAKPAAGRDTREAKPAAREDAKPQAATEEAGKTPVPTRADPVPQVTPAPKDEAKDEAKGEPKGEAAASEAKPESKPAPKPSDAKPAASGAGATKPADVPAKSAASNGAPASGGSESR